MNTLFNNMSAEHFDNKVIVIDSYSLSIVQLSQVLYAYEEVNKGTSIDEIKEKLNERKEDYYLNFVPENLTALKNGGRISPAIAALGNMIGLKPVLALIDGALDKEAMTRNVKKTFAENITKNTETRPIDKYDYIVVSFEGNEELVNYLIREINKFFPDYKVPVLPVAINVCAHCGPGTVGVLIVPRINDHSLNYYLDM